MEWPSKVPECQCRGGEWSFKKFGSRKILADFYGSRSLVFSAVVCVSESRFLDEAVSKSQFFDQQGRVVQSRVKLTQG